MRSRNIKCNLCEKVGSVSCLLLLLLTFLAVNPIVSSSAFAEEIPEDDPNEFVEEAADDNLIETYADVTSTVGVSFSPAKYYAELSPTGSAGQSARIDLSTTIYVYSSGGYNVYLKSDSPNLVGEKNSSNYIPGASTAKTYANMDVNTWGYASAADTTAVSDTATYKAVATSGNGDKLAGSTSTDIEVETKTIALSFATKINDQKAADTYSNTMMLSVVSSPRKVVTPEKAYDFGGITNMQDMTTAICTAAPIGGVKQLKDTRDGKFYWIGKLDDGKCWMTQNLDLDLSTSTTLTTTNSDVSTAGYTPNYATATAASTSGDSTSQRSWSLGDYRIINPNTASNCGSDKSSAADCPDQFTPYSTPMSADGDARAHYILGNHYQWNAATAGTGGSITSGTATNSICPKGWRLPTGDSSGEFQALVTALSAGDITKLITQAPFYGVRGGEVGLSSSPFYGAGARAYYSSSTPSSNANSAYGLNFYGYVYPSNTEARSRGLSVRCVAR